MTSNFKQLLKASFKSEDTEEWLDVYFTRPIGLAFALMWKKLGVHPNTITILSIFLGMAAAYMFYFTDLTHNLAGVVLLMFANFCDSTDGQLARLTGQKTLIGRMLDGFAGDVWFACIYIAITLRTMPQLIPGTDMEWGLLIWCLTVPAGLLCHSPQSSLADYYRQIHLYFLLGKEGSELNTYRQQKEILDNLPEKGATLDKLFYFFYARYCKSQEKRTPQFAQFFALATEKYGSPLNIPAETKKKLLDGSRPLMKYTNILTFNARAILIYITCIANCPWVYMLVEITIFTIIYKYMHYKHETMCKVLTEEIS